MTVEAEMLAEWLLSAKQQLCTRGRFKRGRTRPTGSSYRRAQVAESQNPKQGN